MYFVVVIHNVLQNAIEYLFICVTFVLNYLIVFTKPIISRIFESCGVELNGNNPGDIQIKDDKFYSTMASFKGGTGFYESYIEGYFDSNDLPLTLAKMMAPNVVFVEKWSPYRILKYIVHRYFDVLNVEHTLKIVDEHYNLSYEIIKDIYGSNDQYSTMLLFNRNEIEKAGFADIDSILEKGTFKAREQIARKLKLEPGMKVLDIGCGFGGLAKHLAERYKVEVTGVTISNDMAQHAKKLCKGLSVHIERIDYRCVSGKFDRIVSIEMFEHVGETHHREYFKKVNDLLKDDGLFVFQTSCINHDYPLSYIPMFEKCLQMYVYIPRLEDIVTQSKGLLIVEHMDSLNDCFDITFTAVVKKMNAIKETLIEKYSEKIYRQWLFYLSIAVAGGTTKLNRMYQIVFSKHRYQFAYQE